MSGERDYAAGDLLRWGAPTTTLTLLRMARGLLAKRGVWTQGTEARAANGKATTSVRRACQFCALGALVALAQGHPLPLGCGVMVRGARRRLESVIGGELPDWNDEAGRTLADVLAAYDAAIAGYGRGGKA